MEAPEHESLDRVLKGVTQAWEPRPQFQLPALAPRYGSLERSCSSKRVLHGTSSLQWIEQLPALPKLAQVTKKEEVAGLPITALEQAAQQARERGNKPNATAAAGPWLFSLDGPSYFPVIASAQNR